MLGHRIAQLAARYRVDVLHCHHYSPFVYGQIAALLRRRLRVVFTEHGRLTDKGPTLKRRLANQVIGRLPFAIFSVSADLREFMIREGLPASAVRIIHNGIAVQPIPEMGEGLAVRRELGIDPSALVIGAVGRLDPVKDLETLLAAFAALRNRISTARLILVGDGPERVALEERAASLGLRAAVAFAGYRRDARRLLAAVDIYANSSTHEGVSLTILEAMSAALPVVATRTGGTPEVVEDGVTGCLVPARSPMDMARAFDALASSGERRRRMGQAGRRRVESRFSIDGMARAYLAAYRAARA
jgi:glycosyltransferase involved in cell wall biosynthesis